MLFRNMHIILTVIILVFLPGGTAIADAGNAVGNVKYIRGTAEILREEHKINACENDSVQRKDTVRTFEKSRVKILCIDDSLLMIGPNSSFQIARHFQERTDPPVLKLIDGVMNVIVGTRGLEIHTSTAVAAARGTSYLVWVESGGTGMAVTEGKVELGNIQPGIGKKMVITAGKMSYVASGKPPVVAVRTHPDVIKKFYEQTLEPEDRWGPVILRATGSGIPPPHAVNPAQARLMGVRAARVEALRNLAEQVYGVTIISDSTIQDFVQKSDAIRSRVGSFIKGAWIAEERRLADGTIEVDMEIALGIGFRRMFLEQ